MSLPCYHRLSWGKCDPLEFLLIKWFWPWAKGFLHPRKGLNSHLAHSRGSSEVRKIILRWYFPVRFLSAVHTFVVHTWTNKCRAQFKLPNAACGREAALSAVQSLDTCSCTAVPPVCQEDSHFEWKLLSSRKLSFFANARDQEGFGNHIALLWQTDQDFYFLIAAVREQKDTIL